MANELVLMGDSFILVPSWVSPAIIRTSTTQIWAKGQGTPGKEADVAINEGGAVSVYSSPQLTALHKKGTCHFLSVSVSAPLSVSVFLSLRVVYWPGITQGWCNCTGMSAASQVMWRRQSSLRDCEAGTMPCVILWK